MRVTPAADMVIETANNGGKIVLINLQKTPLDAYATLCIHAKVDDVIDLLFKKLCMQIPAFNLQRWAKIQFKSANNNSTQDSSQEESKSSL